MSETTDPYFDWFKIPKDLRPPNYYELLGLKQFESDPAKISAAVEQRASFLQDINSGPNTAIAQRILNEVAAAKICLLDENKRDAYDESLLDLSSLTEEPEPPAVAKPPRANTATAANTPAVPNAPPVSPKPSAPAPPPVSSPPVSSPAIVVRETVKSSPPASQPQPAQPTTNEKPLNKNLLFGGIGAAAVALIGSIVVVAMLMGGDNKQTSESNTGKDFTSDVQSEEKEQKSETKTKKRTTKFKSSGLLKRNKNLKDALSQKGESKKNSKGDNFKSKGDLKKNSKTPTKTKTAKTTTQPAAKNEQGSPKTVTAVKPEFSREGLVMWLDSADEKTLEIDLAKGTKYIKSWRDKSKNQFVFTGREKYKDLQIKRHQATQIEMVRLQGGRYAKADSKAPMNVGSNYSIAFVGSCTKGVLMSKGVPKNNPGKTFCLMSAPARFQVKDRTFIAPEKDNKDVLKPRIAVATEKSFQWFIDGKLAKTSNSKAVHSINNDAAFMLGRRPYKGSPLPADGWLAEILLFNKPLSSEERQKVEKYLKTKWLSSK